jgi:trk system potassium uptake protein TrkA
MGSNVETLYKIMGGGAEALEFNVGHDFKAADVQLKDVSLKQGVLVAGIIRGKSTIIPSGSDVILPGDKVKLELSTYDLSKGRITWRDK